MAYLFLLKKFLQLINHILVMGEDEELGPVFEQGLDEFADTFHFSFTSKSVGYHKAAHAIVVRLLVLVIL